MKKSELEKYILLLQFLKNHCKNNKACQKNYQNIISYLNDNSVKFLCQCIRNLLAPRNIKLLGDKKEKRLLRKITPHKTKILKIIDRKTSVSQKRHKLQSGGAFVLPLLTSVAPLIISLISKVFKKNRKSGEQNQTDDV